LPLGSAAEISESFEIVQDFPDDVHAPPSGAPPEPAKPRREVSDHR